VGVGVGLLGRVLELEIDQRRHHDREGEGRREVSEERRMTKNLDRRRAGAGLREERPLRQLSIEQRRDGARNDEQPGKRPQKARGADPVHGPVRERAAQDAAHEARAREEREDRLRPARVPQLEREQPEVGQA